MYQSPVRTLMFILLFVSSLGVMDAQEIKIVLAEGVGADPQSAAQNAAQNALTNVVGTFIDANKQLEKRAEIANGIRTQTTQIKTDIREYSQGSIKSLEIVETKQDGPFCRVTAKVAVRVDDFRAYIKKLAEGETAVGGGLFAEMTTSARQEDSLAKILSERILAVFNGEVVDFTVGKPIPYRRSPYADAPGDGITAERYIGDAIKEGRLSPDALIAFEVTAKLNAAFLDNLTKTLESSASSKQRLSLQNSRSASEVLCKDGPSPEKATAGFCLPVADGVKLPLKVTAYGFGIAESKFKPFLPWLPDEYRFTMGRATGTDGRNLNGIVPPAIEVSILDSQGHELQSESSRDQSQQQSNMWIVGLRYGACAECVPGYPWVLYTALGRHAAIIKERTFGVVMKVNEASLHDAASIRVKLVK